MKSISSLASVEGRIMLHKAYRDLLFEKRMGLISTLLICWKICSVERNLSRYTDYECTIEQPLGAVSGTILWMQEIVNRFHFSTVNSFVYFGAAILLVVIGLRRMFENSISDGFVIGSIILEASMLIFMFIVMFFSPPDNDEIDIESSSEEVEEVQDIVREIGEIARDYASISVRLDSIAETLETVTRNQELLTKATHQAITAATSAVSPNPEMVEVMRVTNLALRDLASTVEKLNKSTAQIEKTAIEQAVRTELTRIIGNNVSGHHA